MIRSEARLATAYPGMKIGLRRQLRSRARGPRARRRNSIETARPRPRLVAGLAANPLKPKSSPLAERTASARARRRMAQNGRHRSGAATRLRLHLPDAARAETALSRRRIHVDHGPTTSPASANGEIGVVVVEAVPVVIVSRHGVERRIGLSAPRGWRYLKRQTPQGSSTAIRSGRRGRYETKRK